MNNSRLSVMLGSFGRMYYLTIFLSLIVVFAVISLSELVGRLFGLEVRTTAFTILGLCILLVAANLFFIIRLSKTAPIGYGAAAVYLVIVCVAAWGFGAGRISFDPELSG